MFVTLHDFLKFLDELLGISSYSYMQVTLLFALILFATIFTLYRLSLGAGATRRISEELEKSPYLKIIAIVTLLPLILLLMSTRNIELQYLLLMVVLIFSLLLHYLFASRFTTIFITVALLPLTEILTILNLGVEVGEQTPDTAVILSSGHWIKSLKDPYYDLINVYSTTKASLNIVMGIDDPESIITYMLLAITNLIIALLTIYLIAKVAYDIPHGLALPALLILISNPGLYLVASPPSLSMAFALLTILVILKLFKNREKYTIGIGVSIPLFLASILTHGTGIIVLFFLAIMLFLLVFLGKQGYGRWYLYVFFALITVYFATFSIRTLYTGALYGAFQTYKGEFIRWIMGFPRGELALREVKWSAEVVPRITAFAWALLPVVAVVPLTSNILGWVSARRKRFLRRSLDSKNLIYSSFTLTGILFTGLGFTTTLFSNSLGRELYYPGLMMLSMAVPYALKNLSKRGGIWRVTCLLILASLMLGLATPSKIPLYEPYRELTLAWRGSDSTHYIYAKTTASLIGSSVSTTVYAASDDVMPIKTSYLIIHGEPLTIHIIHVRGTFNNDSLNKILTFDKENYIMFK